MRLLPYLFILLCLGLCTCLKPPSYSIVPQIVFKSVQFDTVSASQNQNDSITFTFQDGDGDLGTAATPDTSRHDTLCQRYNTTAFFDTACNKYDVAYDLFYLDSRDNNGIRCMKLAQIPVIPTKGSSKAISGDISFRTFGFTQLPGRTLDSLCYYIVIRDQAGHCSNIIKTSTIYIKP